MFFSTTTDNGRRFFGRYDGFRVTEMFERCIFELVACLIRDECRTREDGEILEDIFFAISKTRSLDTEDREDSFEFIEYDTCERFSIDIVSDDDEFSTSALSEWFQYSDDIFEWWLKQNI